MGYPGRIDVANLVKQYSKDPRLAYLYPGARDCLEALALAGHTLICITNGFRCYQEPVMRTLGIYHHFTAIITPDAVGAAKPQEAIFRAGEAYGSSPIHVGDNLLHDIAAAKRVGWKAVCVVQAGHMRSLPLSAELSALLPWDRPAKGMGWLRVRLERDRRWHGDPPVAAAMPDAIVLDLQELPETVSRISTA
jgi:FMN phosphatase YigB (HAD superfamily)